MQDWMTLAAAALATSVAAWHCIRHRRSLLEVGRAFWERMCLPVSGRRFDEVVSVVGAALIVFVALLLWAGAVEALLRAFS
jgi:ABC-type nickel/cobalt efflux system permease component RcnA